MKKDLTDGAVSEAFLERFAFTPMGVFGRLTVRDFTCYTVERPWLSNTPYISCFPDGTYPLKFRSSLRLSEITRGAYTQAFEIEVKQGRTHLLFHPANSMYDVEGCVGVGDRLGALTVEGEGTVWAVLNSKATFKLLMEAFGSTTWKITVSSTEGASTRWEV